MKVTDFNREVNLLEIVNKNKADQNQSVDKKAESFKETFSKEIARTNNVNFSKHALLETCTATPVFEGDRDDRSEARSAFTSDRQSRRKGLERHADFG